MNNPSDKEIREAYARGRAKADQNKAGLREFLKKTRGTNTQKVLQHAMTKHDVSVIMGMPPKTRDYLLKYVVQFASAGYAEVMTEITEEILDA